MNDSLNDPRKALLKEFEADKRHLYSLMLFQFIKHQNSDRFEAYSEICQNIGYDTVNFIEVDFWWNRFENGNFDFNVEKSEIPTNGMLETMPLRIIHTIIGKLSLKEIFTLRMVNREFRNIIGRKAIHFKQSEMRLNYFNDALHFDWEMDDYKVRLQPLYECTREIDDEDEEDYTITSMEEFEEFVRKGLRKMAVVFNHPNVHFEKLKFWINAPEKEMRNTFFETFSEVVECSGKKLSVEKLIIDVKTTEEMLPILPNLQPGTLKEIVLTADENKRFYDGKEFSSIIFKTEQWKQAKMVVIEIPEMDFHTSFFAHLEKFDIEAFSSVITPQEVIEVMNKLLERPNFEVGIFRCHRKLDSEKMNKHFKKIDPEGPREKNVWHVPIPGSDDFLKVSTTENSVLFQRNR